MHIDIERLNEDPKVAKEFLEDELQKARQPQRVHYFITTADWMFWENKNRKGYAGNPVTSAQNVDRIHDSTETGGKVPEDAIEVFYPHGCGRWLKSMSYYKADDAERLFHLAYCISEDMTFEGEDKVIDAAIAELSQRHVSSDSDLCFSFTRTGKDGRENDFFREMSDSFSKRLFGRVNVEPHALLLNKSIYFSSEILFEAISVGD